MDWLPVDDDKRLMDLSGDERLVDLSGDEDWADDSPVLPQTTRDDTDTGWGEVARDNDERLLAERPPHWS